MIKDEIKDEFDHVIDELKEGVGPGGAYEPAAGNARKHPAVVAAIMVVAIAAIVLLVRTCS